MANKNTFYFDHDYSARNDEKILELRAEFGWKGYGLFWAMLESMCENGGYLKSQALGGLSLGLSVSVDLLKKVIVKCVGIGLFVENEGMISNLRIQDHLVKRQSLSEAGKRGGRPKKATLKPPLSHPKATPKAGEERRGEDRKEDELKNVAGSEKISDAVTVPQKYPDLPATRPVNADYTQPVATHEEEQIKTADENNRKWFEQAKNDTEWLIVVERITRLDKILTSFAVNEFDLYLQGTHERHDTDNFWRKHCINWIERRIKDIQEKFSQQSKPKQGGKTYEILS